MKLSEWADLAEIGAAIGVIVSPIFVEMELRSNTAATEAATREAVNQKAIQFLSPRIDSSVLVEAHANLESGQELSTLEETQLLHQEYVNFVAFENSYYQYRKGVQEQQEWLRHRNIVRLQIEQFPYSQVMWRRSRATFDPEFRRLVDGYIADRTRLNDFGVSAKAF